MLRILLLLVLVATAVAFWWGQKRLTRPAGPERTGFRRRLLRPASGQRDPTLQSISNAAAEQLGAVVMLLEKRRGKLQAMACAPWGAPLSKLDSLAACAAFDDGLAAGKGSGRHGMSDWLFVPIEAGASVLGVVALAGRNCRRSFDPVSDPNVVGLVDAFRSVLRPYSTQPPPPCPIQPVTTAANGRKIA